MPTASAILKKVNKAFGKVTPQDTRTVYKRFITRIQGDPLIGRPGIVNGEDTLLDPQPLYQRLGKYPVGPVSKADLVLDSSGSAYIGNDYMCVFSASAISYDELRNPDLLIVFKDSSGNEELYRVDDYDPAGFQGTDILFTTYIKSTKRP